MTEQIYSVPNISGFGRLIRISGTYRMAQAIGPEEKNFGSLVRQLRGSKGFTQESFADHLGIDRSYQGRIEHGEASVTLHKINIIAKALAP